MRDFMRLVSKRFAKGENTTYHRTILRQITPIQKCHKQITYKNNRILLLFLKMYSMKQFPGTFLKYLTKHEDDRLFQLVYESSDRGKVTETSLSLKKLVESAFCILSKKFLLAKERASSPVLYPSWLSKTIWFYSSSDVD